MNQLDDFLTAVSPVLVIEIQTSVKQTSLLVNSVTADPAAVG